MTRVSNKEAVKLMERPGPRRTAPANKSCPTPEQLHKIYNEGRKRIAGSAGDGLVSKKLHDYEVTVQQPQFLEDQHVTGGGSNGSVHQYHNDVKDYAALRSYFDHGKLDQHSKPQKAKGPKCEATGQDMHKSPFSKASQTYGED
jgi:hypothetical protein